MVDKNDLEVVKMKKVLVIGSAVVDVVIHLPHLPEKSEDVHVTSQKMSLEAVPIMRRIRSGILKFRIFLFFQWEPGRMEIL